MPVLLTMNNKGVQTTPIKTGERVEFEAKHSKSKPNKLKQTPEVLEVNKVRRV